MLESECAGVVCHSFDRTGAIDVEMDWTTLDFRPLWRGDRERAINKYKNYDQERNVEQTVLFSTEMHAGKILP